MSPSLGEMFFAFFHGGGGSWTSGSLVGQVESQTKPEQIASYLNDPLRPTNFDFSFSVNPVTTLLSRTDLTKASASSLFEVLM